MKRTLIGVFLLSFMHLIQAADIDAGRQKAAACAGCHGVDGIATNPDYPSLAGQNAAYLLAAMKAYQEGHRNHPVMRAMVSALGDMDLENIAAYYGSLKK